ncbi:ABC transporter substrate-binding protein [Halomonas huangheensis]|uniref:Fe/B12 periplasmic-binding domain-containing protein n=1 Tax=Halomonas huangheensis TaxID=1178482 RepID=W1NAB7_9GAMM|nr:ABC transporter substrate-binding protein [Halomonas huangheensis]ALM53658.1 hypothetical protein AR456_16295 [Halomonas huangheensis]ERL52438.1 hypothetical protein BJB45_10755 [Halomonas huangheensis]
MLKPLAIASLLAVTAQAWADTDAQRIAALDYAALDTLTALGQGERIAGVPRSSLPEYLSSYASDDYADVGSLKAPEYKVLDELAPDSIVISGRLGGEKDQLEEIAPTWQNGSAEGNDYWSQLEANTHALAEEYGVDDQAGPALDTLHADIAEAVATIEGSPEVLVVLHNDGKLVYRQDPVINDLMSLSSPTLPDDVETQTRGERSFTTLTPAQISAMAPDLVWVVDRSAAIGQPPLNIETLHSELGDLHVVKGSPRLWYLASGGLKSTLLQVNEVVSALQQ